MVFGHKYGGRSAKPFVIEFVCNGILNVTTALVGVGTSLTGERLCMSAVYSYRPPEFNYIFVLAQKGGKRGKPVMKKKK